VSLELFLDGLTNLVRKHSDRTQAARLVAESLAAERHYRWVGLYEVTPIDIGMLACTGATHPAYLRFPVTRGLCGTTVAAKAIVNVGNVQEDPRWLTTFGTTRSEIIVPVFGNDSRVCGLIDVESEALNAFSEADEEFLRACARVITQLF
jgi:L-methionine (R)-S-oxide reductase